MAQLQQDNLFYDVQKKVCDIINSSPDLSAIGFFPANEKDLETQITASLRKQGVCGIVIVNEAEFQGFQDGMDTAWKITDLAVQIVENAIVNRASNNTGFLGTCQDIAAKVSQVLGSPEYGWHGFFNLKKYEEGEDGGLITAKVTFQASVQTNISSYVPPSAPDQKFPFATQGWVLSNFLPLSGGTLSGGLHIECDENVPFSIKGHNGLSVSDYAAGIEFHTDGYEFCFTTNDNYSAISPDGSQIMTENLVDAKISADCARKSELSNYLPLSGGTLSGGLNIKDAMFSINGNSGLSIDTNAGGVEFNTDSQEFGFNNLEGFSWLLPDGSQILTETEGNTRYYSKTAGTTNRNSINAINSKIPAQATSSNQLADKNFVNSSIATETAYFRGTYNSVAELPTTGVTNNDYAFVIRTDSLGQTFYDRYKYSSQTRTWAFEYSVNNTGFTAAQYAAINSGITEAKVQDIDEIKENYATKDELSEKADWGSTLEDYGIVDAVSDTGGTINGSLYVTGDDAQLNLSHPYDNDAHLRVEGQGNYGSSYGTNCINNPQGNDLIFPTGPGTFALDEQISTVYAKKTDVYLKSQLSTLNLSGEYEGGGTFSFNMIYVK